MESYFSNPLAYYGLLSIAMIACLFLFLTTERKLQRTQRQLGRDIEGAERGRATIGTQVSALEVRLADWSDRTTELEERVAGLAAVRRANTLTTGVNSNQRAQVLRMARRGQRAEQIAAELHVPRGEVDLLLKVQRAVVRVS